MEVGTNGDHQDFFLDYLENFDIPFLETSTLLFDRT
jgi:hypothetical protein